MHLCMNNTQKKKWRILKTYIYLMMYHCHQIHYKMHNNINACLYVRKKTIVYRLHYPLPPMHETKFLEPFHMGIVHFHNNTSIHKQKKFNLWKFKRKRKYIIFLILRFFEFWWKNLYIKFEKQINKTTFFKKT